jgi:hypothetical protein
MIMPKYSNPGGVFPSVPLLPPFYFENMTVRMFPLRARLATLQNFVDRYLNIIPAEIGRYRVMLPYAYLMMIDYGKLAAQTKNVGWVAQREVMFIIPLEHYRVVDGRWVFVDWALATPFIFVDDYFALVLGRQVYGWPKLLCQMTPTLSAWMRDPRAPIRAATLSTPVFSEIYGGEAQDWRVLLEVDREEPLSPFQMPLDMASPYAPWTAMGNVAASMAGFGRDYMGLLAGMGIMPSQEGSDPANYLRMAMEAARMINPFQARDPAPFPWSGGGPSTNLFANTLNLMQFRDSANPERYCFQSLTSAAMSVVSMNAGGLLGDMSTLWGDPSGGYTLRFYDWPSLPIVDALGLETARHWRGDGVGVSELKPVLPFWYQVDMIYERGENVAWRTFDTLWHDQEGKVYPPEETTPGTEGLYNSTLGSSSQTVAGPFDFPCSTVRVLPLLARKATLQKFLHDYLNEALATTNVSFELWSADDSEYAYVYVMAWKYGDTASGTDNIGDWAKEDVNFMVPVKYMRDGEVRSLGLVPVFTFVDDTTSPIADTEVLGWPTNKGIFVSPPSVWMSNPSGEAHQPLLRVAAEVLPSLDQGQKAVERIVLEVHQGEMVDQNAQLLADQWALLLRDELERKKRVKHSAEGRHDLQRARVLSLELLANSVPWNVFTLKQFRDVHEPTRACYQSIVRIPRTIEHLYDLREIQEPIHMRLQEYPSLPMVELLGLVATLAQDQAGGISYLLRPVRPFWMKMAWKEGLGERMMYRCGSEQWKGDPEHEPDSPWTPYFADGQQPAVDIRLGDVVDDGKPHHLDFLTYEWIHLLGKGMSLAEAKHAVGAIDPQMIIETLLAREWENQSQDTRWRQGWNALDRGRRLRVEGKSGSERMLAEIAFFEEELEKIEHQRHYQPATRPIEVKLWRLVGLGAARSMMEASASAPDDDVAKQTFAEGLQRVSVPGTHSVNMPDTPLPERSDDARDKLLKERLRQLGALDAFNAFDQATFDVFWNRSRKDPRHLHQVVELVRQEHKRQRESVLDRMSKASQEPDFCVPRSAAGSEKDRLFPKEYSWKGWYVGPEPIKSPGKDA